MLSQPPPDPEIDLDAYLDRIEYNGPLAATAGVLADLHLAHSTHIPFENIDVLLGITPKLDLESLQTKLIRGRRGGYCFEQNLLFAAVLERVGFRVTRLAARVWYGASRRRPRTHMLLRVDLAEGAWVADVGFGGGGPLQPLPLIDGRETQQFSWAYRPVRGAGTWMLQSREAEGWADLYEFSEEPQDPVDYEPLNHFVATHPSSPFTRTLTAQRPAPDAHFVLRGRELVTDHGGRRVEKRTVTEEEVFDVLDRTFGLRLPAGTRLPVESPENPAP
jgi:N-hydroxyarylamine O-acetyltransferase